MEHSREEESHLEPSDGNEVGRPGDRWEPAVAIEDKNDVQRLGC